MKGDFTRNTFDRVHHFSRVLMQQGRVTLDADHNEQTEILLHYLRTLAVDLLGPHAAPADGGGFKLSADATGNLVIGAGRYYVDGILVENDDDCLYAEQGDFPTSAKDPIVGDMNNPGAKTYWVYLDVWERHITSLEDDFIREKALGGPDTCTRTKVVWQVRSFDVEERYAEKRAELEAARAATTDPEQAAALDAQIEHIDDMVAEIDKRKFTVSCEDPLTLLTAGDSKLAARVDPGLTSTNVCITPPDAKYRGAENQLYRVEVHTGGDAGTATFKWSRDNGSVAAAWLGTSGNEVQVSTTRGFSAGSWVELTDDVRELAGVPGALVQVTKVGSESLTFASLAGADAFSTSLINPRVRQWDETANGSTTLLAGAVPIVETPTDAVPDDVNWIDLEDGVQVQFAEGGTYSTGDYWLIPARVASGNVEWPAEDNGQPALRAPAGVEHHFAPLGFVWWKNKTIVTGGCRCEITPSTTCFSTAPVLGADRKPDVVKPVPIKVPKKPKGPRPPL